MHEVDASMSDERRPSGIAGVRQVGAAERVGAADAVAAVEAAGAVAAVAPVEAASAVAAVGAVAVVGGAAAIMAAVAARLEAGVVDRRGAVRSVVAEVVARELTGVDAVSRAEVVDEVVEVILAEPSWRARVLGALEGGGS